MSTLWVLGSLNVDDVIPVPHLPTPGETVVADEAVAPAWFGGKGANQAVAAAGAGVRVEMLGAVGDDEDGRAYRQRLVARGIGTRGLATLPEPTGRAVVLLDGTGENSIVVVPGANAHVHDVSALDDAEPGDVLLCSLEVPLATVERAVALVADRDVRVVVNAAPFAPLSQATIDRCDPVVVNESEAMALADAGALPPSLLVTFGERGVAWNGIEREALPVDGVLDTTGAGDAFTGTLAGRLACGDTDEEALDAALAAAAACVCREGAQVDGLPD